MVLWTINQDNTVGIEANDNLMVQSSDFMVDVWVFHVICGLKRLL